MGSKYHVQARDNSKMEQCPICLEKRACLSSHLLRYHNVSRKTPAIKELGLSKVSGTKMIVAKQHESLDEILNSYETEHFGGHLDGARISVKKETAERTRRSKMELTRKMTYFIADKCQEYNIVAVIKNVRLLGTPVTGYFDSVRKISSDKGEWL